MELEEELEHYIARHKSVIVLTSLLAFYKEQQQAGLNSFTDSELEQATLHHYIALLNDKELYDKIYNDCWEKIKVALPR